MKPEADKSIRWLMIAVVITVLAFLILSMFDCVLVYSKAKIISQNPSSINDYRVNTYKMNNMPKVLTGFIILQLFFMFTRHFKLTIFMAAIEAASTAFMFIAKDFVSAYDRGMLMMHVIEVTSEFTVAGYLVVFCAIVNLTLTVILKIRVKACLQGGQAL